MHTEGVRHGRVSQAFSLPSDERRHPVRCTGL